MMRRRAIAAVVAAAATSLVLAACSSGGSSGASSPSSSSGSSSSVTLTWWNNATSGGLESVWNNAIKSFEASHPNIKITNVPVESNTLQKTKIPLALQGNDMPNVFQQWGGGSEASQIASGKLADITSLTSSWASSVNGIGGWQVNGKTYGVPYDLHAVGFWYRKDLFQQAGITTPPTTIAELESDDAKLKAKGITPIAVGSGDSWPDAFWWESFAIRECPQATITSAISSKNFSDACFGKATTDLQSFIATTPFQKGFQATKAQTGVGSSAGLVATGKAAMELQGDWDPGVMQGLVSSSAATTLNSELGWFAFPSIPGAAGSQTGSLDGGDGFSCSGSTAQVQACVEFLQYIDSPAIQTKVVTIGNSGLPVVTAAASGLSSGDQAAATQLKDPANELYFDIALPTKPGQNLDTAIANYFTTQSSGNAAAILSSPSAP
jgi:raffinose/stachyose/melibiose transport system substrate-binding protein